MIEKKTVRQRKKRPVLLFPQLMSRSPRSPWEIHFNNFFSLFLLLMCTPLPSIWEEGEYGLKKRGGEKQGSEREGNSCSL